jgi:hypothetical protein
MRYMDEHSGLASSRRTSDWPNNNSPYDNLVKLLFSFRGVTEVEVLAERIHADK